MFDKYTINIDDAFLPLFKRFVEAIERIAPPVPDDTPTSPSTEDDVISLTDAEYHQKSLQWELDDLSERLMAKGVKGNEEELKGLQELKELLAEEDAYRKDEDGDD